MDLSETDDHFTIVNRSMKYRVSKRLLRKIPYFEKMFNHDLQETEENRVELNFETKAFRSIFDWIERGCIFIEMDYVINMCNIADYFGLNDCLLDDFVTYFDENFTTQHIPVVISQVTSSSKLINIHTLNAFICRYFSKIANTTVWLKYPFELIEYICALDLMINSEVQVFDAIMRWVEFNSVSRKCYLEQLLKLIRCCHLGDADLSKVKDNGLIKSSEFESKLFSCNTPNCNCNDRTKQGVFVAIMESDDKNLRVIVFDGDFLPLIDQMVQLDESLPLNLLCDEHISDISFDSGRQMIRIDWKQNKYRLLDFKDFRSHYHKIHSCIYQNQKSGANYCVETRPKTLTSYKIYESSLLETAEKFLLVRDDQFHFNCWENPSMSIFCGSFGHTYLTTVLDNNIFMLNRNLEFMRFEIGYGLKFERIGLERFKDKWTFNDLFLISKQADDNRIIFVAKTTKDVYCFNVNTREFKSIGRIINCKSKPLDEPKSTNVLKTFTFGFVSIASIKLSRHEVISIL